MYIVASSREQLAVGLEKGWCIGNDIHVPEAMCRLDSDWRFKGLDAKLNNL